MFRVQNATRAMAGKYMLKAVNASGEDVADTELVHLYKRTCNDLRSFRSFSASPQHRRALLKYSTCMRIIVRSSGIRQRTMAACRLIMLEIF